MKTSNLATKKTFVPHSKPKVTASLPTSQNAEAFPSSVAASSMISLGSNISNEETETYKVNAESFENYDPHLFMQPNSRVREMPNSSNANYAPTPTVSISGANTVRQLINGITTLTSVKPVISSSFSGSSTINNGGQIIPAPVARSQSLVSNSSNPSIPIKSPPQLPISSSSSTAQDTTTTSAKVRRKRKITTKSTETESSEKKAQKSFNYSSFPASYGEVKETKKLRVYLKLSSAASGGIDGITLMSVEDRAVVGKVDLVELQKLNPHVSSDAIKVNDVVLSVNNLDARYATFDRVSKALFKQPNDAHLGNGGSVSSIVGMSRTALKNSVVDSIACVVFIRAINQEVTPDDNSKV